MQYEAKSPTEYIKNLDKDWRLKTLKSIRAIIKKAAPELKEKINYKMLGYAHGDEFVFHLNAQKNYVSFYVGNAEKVDPKGKLLEGLDVGKGCIRFKKSVDVSETQIDAFIDKAVAAWRKGKDIGC